MSSQILKTPDTSSELLVMPFQGGVKLVRPNAISSTWRYQTIGEILRLPFHVYFTNTVSTIININEDCAINCGFISIRDALGKSVHNVATKKTIDFEMQHERSVMRLQKMIIKDENYQRLKDESILPGLAIKFPWFDADNKILGVFGFSVLGTPYYNSMANALLAIIDTGLLNHSKIHRNIFPLARDKTSALSPRETAIVQQLVKGKTAKGIANTLHLSPRTVENYLANIKMKMNVTSKSALIEKALSCLDLS